MKLDEEYNIMTACGLVTCQGKRYDDEFAIVHNWKENVFNMTHIASGTGISPHGYNTLKECIEHAETDINLASDFLEKNPDRKLKWIELYNECMEKHIFNNVSYV